MTAGEASERIAAAFEAGIAPWSRSGWVAINCGLPVSAATGKPFLGANCWLLELAAIDRLHRNRYWASRGQWHDLGGVVTRGEGTPVIDDGIVGKSDEDLVLYNAEQVEVRRGAPVTALDRFWVAPPAPDYDRARRLLEGTGARVVVVADRCYCALCPAPSRDFIARTPMDRTWGEDWWWSADFHGLTHWAAEGFDRVRFRGSYNHCELVAEIGATLLTDRCGIPTRLGMPADTGMLGEWVSGIRASIGYPTIAWAVAWSLSSGSRSAGRVIHPGGDHGASTGRGPDVPWGRRLPIRDRRAAGVGSAAGLGGFLLAGLVMAGVAHNFWMGGDIPPRCPRCGKSWAPRELE